MEMPKYKTALIVGAGEGLSASLARLFAREGSMSRSPRARSRSSARSAEKPARMPMPAMPPTPTRSSGCSAWSSAKSARPISWSTTPAGGRAAPSSTSCRRKSRNAIAVSAFGGFLVAQQAAKRMLPNKHGAILFTGASASVKGYPQSAPFAMGKFALRGLAQSMARELSPQGIHVAHFVIDGGIRSATRLDPPDRPDSLLDPDAIALSYWNVLQQPRSAWSWELELRPWVEKF